MHYMLKDFWNLLFPRTCVACHEQVLVQEEEFMCTYCRAKLPQTDYHVHSTDNPLYQKLAAHVPVKHAFAYLLFTKSGRTQQLLHHLKYKDMPALGEALGRSYGSVLAEYAYQQQYDALVPVPLHKKRLAKRGYNQSYHFALGIGDSLGLPVWDDVLVREQMRETQTKKSRLKRWQNVEDIFAVTQTDKVAGKRLLVVDDVITTGATISSCVASLMQAQCKDLGCAALATA